MKKNPILGLLALGLAMTPLAASQAQGTPPRPNPEARQERAADRLATRQERLAQAGGRIIERLTKTALRFEEVIARLLAHIERKMAAGADLAAAKAKVDEAAKINTEAKSVLATLSPKLTEALAATDLKTAFQTLRPELEKVRVSLRLVHTTLVEALKLVRTAQTTNN